MEIIDEIRKCSIMQPNKIAYQINGEKLTYAELEEKSNSLANAIQLQMKRDKTPIIIYGHKDKYMLICFLACVKSGRGYCPIDTSVPIERTKQIIETVNSKIILCPEESKLEDSRVWDIDKIKEESEKNEKIDKKYYVKENDVFYIIFTSGSTGIPKGVQITVNCLNNFLKWSKRLGKIDQKRDLIFLNQAPFSFDLSVMDLYTSLATGSTLVAIDKDTQTDMEKLFDLLKKSNANIWVSTPSFINMCLSDKKFNRELLPKLETFLFCGEVLQNSTAEKIMNRFEDSEVINTYGPTEATVAVTNVTITKEMIKRQQSLPVGKPKENTYILIQNHKKENLPENEKGEIVIVGDTVSIGYFNNYEKTKKVFENYKINNIDYRAYRTGDKGYIQNGQLYYCGRLDFQVKLHGYRIEIEDIENNIARVKSVKSVAVIPKYEDDNITVKYLQAYIVTKNIVKNKNEEITKIKEELKNILPHYMIPKKIKFIDKMPMTNNCKIDRKVLGEL